MSRTAARRKPLSAYRPPSLGIHSIESVSLSYWIECPKCGGRVMDISALPEQFIIIGCKCPCCNQFVDFPLITLIE